MVAFIETRLPDAIIQKAAGGPEFSTAVVTLASGHEQRNANWSIARAKYSIAYNELSQAERDTLLTFFRVVNGRAKGFRFKDWSDYQAAGEIIGIGDGSTSQFQLIKTYSAGATTVSRTITKPVNGTASIYIDTVLLGGGYSVDTTTGIVTFSSPPNIGDVLSADFEFDVPVRFDTDHCAATLESYNSGSWNGIKLVEVRI